MQFSNLDGGSILVLAILGTGISVAICYYTIYFAVKNAIKDAKK